MGGFDLAAEWMGWENIFHCEWAPFGQRILKYYWPRAASISNIREKDFSEYADRIDILTGGFPCQGFSLAGKRLGTQDERYLWPEMLRVIIQTRPTFVLGENVTGILSMADKSGIWSEVFPRMAGRKIVRYDIVDYYEAVYTRQTKVLVSSICKDLENAGYEVQPFAIPAGAVGAPHKRERIWFLAYSGGYGPFDAQNRPGHRKGTDLYTPGQEPAFQPEGRSGPPARKVAAYANGLRGFDRPYEGHIPQENEKIRKGIQLKTDRPGIQRPASGEKNAEHTPCLGFEEPDLARKPEKAGTSDWRHITDWQNWPSQPPVCDGNDGLSTRLDGITLPKWRAESIKSGGNAVVPHIPYQFFKAIDQFLKSC